MIKTAIKLMGTQLLSIYQMYAANSRTTLTSVKMCEGVLPTPAVSFL